MRSWWVRPVRGVSRRCATRRPASVPAETPTPSSSTRDSAFAPAWGRFARRVRTDWLSRQLGAVGWNAAISRRITGRADLRRIRTAAVGSLVSHAASAGLHAVAGVALAAALREYSGIWFGWSGEVSATPTINTEEVGNITYVTLPLNKRDYDQYYRGFSNATLWPIFHYRIDLARYSREEYDGYRRVNAMLAEKLMPLLRPDDIIWIHDYHLIPFAEACRQLGVRNRIGFFLHIPFPAPEILTAIPPHNDLLKTLCYYDLIGFQTDTDRLAFQDYITREVRGVIEPDGSLTAYGQNFRAGVYPIGVVPDEIQQLAEGYKGRAHPMRRATDTRRQTIISVDRLDYSKGLPERFRGFERYLETRREQRGNRPLG